MRQLFLVLLLSTLACAAPTSVCIVDGSGAPLKDVLVILKSLDNHYFDVSRQLTDEQGKTRSVELKHGLYRIIATTPYGVWKTTIREFLVGDEPINLKITADANPTHGLGDVISVGADHAELQVLKADGSPAAGAKVLIRDRDATLSLERWYKMDENGKSKIELVGSPTVVVVVYDGKLMTTQLAQTDTRPIVRFSPD